MPARTRRPAVEAEAAAAVETPADEQPAPTTVAVPDDEQPAPAEPTPPAPVWPDVVHVTDDGTLVRLLPNSSSETGPTFEPITPPEARRDLFGRPIQPEPEPVQVLFVRAMGEVGAIAKEGRITEGPQKYAFRGIEQVQQRLQPILVKHGLVILPTTLERIDHPVRTTRSGGSMYAVALHVRFTVYGPLGDTMEMDAWGEGADTGDKSSGKAHSMAYKTAMLEAFCIPTETDSPDADRTVPEDTFSDEQMERARRAWAAALEANDEPTLAGVRHRASALLEVPVDVDGQSMALDQAFTGRRRFLVSQAQQQDRHESRAPQGDTGLPGEGGEQG